MLSTVLDLLLKKCNLLLFTSFTSYITSYITFFSRPTEVVIAYLHHKILTAIQCGFWPNDEAEIYY